MNVMRNRDFLHWCVLGLCLCGLSLLLPGRVNAGTLEDDIQAELRAIREHRAVEAMREVWDIEAGELAEDATEEALEDAKDLMTDLHDGGVKDDLAEMAAVAFRELTKPEKRSIGVCTLTGYCNCSACCGAWSGGPCASGAWPTSGHTVAADLPFGTRVEINGHEYVVEDRGVSGSWFDIYFDSHAEACAFGMQSAEVFIIEG